MSDTDKEAIPKKKNLTLAAVRSVLLSVLTTIAASALVGKSKTFLKKENLADTALEFGTSLAVFGILDAAKAIKHNKEVDELTKKQPEKKSFAESIEQEKSARAPSPSVPSR